MQVLRESEQRQIRMWQYAVIVLALFLARTMHWAISELWYDEVITLSDFVLGQTSLLGVFRSYPVANNHILFSAVEWIWLRFVDFNLCEHILRLPSLLFSVFALLTVMFGWRKWLGVRMACVCGFAFAVCPVFTGFAYQMRGYALSMLLVTLTVPGVMEIVSGNRVRGLWLHGICTFLLPLVIPTNILVVAANVAFIAVMTGRLPLRRRLALLLLVALPGILGAAYYLTILDKFRAVMAQTAGWNNRWELTGNLGLAVLAHGGVFALLFLRVLVRHFRKAAPLRNDAGLEPVLRWLACCAAAIAFLILVSPKAPYPRVFLAFLPIVSFCLFRGLRHCCELRNVGMLLRIGMVVLNGFVWERAATWLTARQMAEGQHPQNLIQQYYRGSLDLRGLVAEIARMSSSSPQAMVMTDAYDFPTFRYYWVRFNLPTGAVFTNREDMLQAWQNSRRSGVNMLWVVAGDELHAAELFRQAGMDGRFDSLIRVGGKGLYGTLTTYPDNDGS